MDNESVNKVYTNKENNLKKYAFFITFLGVISFCLILIYFENNGIIPGIVLLGVCGINSLFLYGIGEIIDLLRENANDTKKIIKILENKR